MSKIIGPSDLEFFKHRFRLDLRRSIVAYGKRVHIMRHGRDCANPFELRSPLASTRNPQNDNDGPKVAGGLFHF